jgi:hypothetical protein
MKTSKIDAQYTIKSIWWFIPASCDKNLFIITHKKAARGHGQAHGHDISLQPSDLGKSCNLSSTMSCLPACPLEDMLLTGIQCAHLSS